MLKSIQSSVDINDFDHARHPHRAASWHTSHMALKSLTPNLTLDYIAVLDVVWNCLQMFISKVTLLVRLRDSTRVIILIFLGYSQLVKRCRDFFFFQYSFFFIWCISLFMITVGNCFIISTTFNLRPHLTSRPLSPFSTKLQSGGYILNYFRELYQGKNLKDLSWDSS